MTHRVVVEDVEGGFSTESGREGSRQNRVSRKGRSEKTVFGDSTVSREIQEFFVATRFLVNSSLSVHKSAERTDDTIQHRGQVAS